MGVKINKSGAASKADLSALENFLGVSLPSDFSEFLCEYDGAVPEPNIFRISESNDSGVNGFVPANRILGECERIENLPPHAFPFAWTEGGNYVVLDLDAGGKVFFWNHETADMTKIADDFDSFLVALRPFSLDDVELKPGQVKSVWVDPELLKRFS